jgi:integrase
VSKTVRRIALGEAFWPQGLRTRGASTDNISWMLPDVARRWKQRLGDFTEYRLPEMDRYALTCRSCPMAGLRPPHITDRPVPVFAGGELLRLERACAGRSFQQCRDAAVIAVFRATGMRLSELAAIRYDPNEPWRSDVDLWRRGSPPTARAARPGPSRSTTTPPAASTGTFASAPGMPRPTGRSCGSAPTIAARRPAGPSPPHALKVPAAR